jgi:hypothetical protein
MWGSRRLTTLRPSRPATGIAVPFSSSVHITLNSMLLKIIPFGLYTSPLSVQALQSRSCLLRILCYNGSLLIWTVVSLTTAKFMPFMFSVSGFALSYTTNIFFLMNLYDFCLLPAQFCYIIVYIRKVGNRVQIANRYAPWKISNGEENLVL